VQRRGGGSKTVKRVGAKTKKWEGKREKKLRCGKGRPVSLRVGENPTANTSNRKEKSCPRRVSEEIQKTRGEKIREKKNGNRQKRTAPRKKNGEFLLARGGGKKRESQEKGMNGRHSWRGKERRD